MLSYEKRLEVRWFRVVNSMRSEGAAAVKDFELTAIGPAIDKMNDFIQSAVASSDDGGVVDILAKGDDDNGRCRRR